MRFKVLGPVVVETDDGADVTPRGSQPRRLLAALVARTPDAVTTGELNELLWPGRASSPNALQAQVSKLRKALGGTEIASDGRGYALRLGPADTVDAAEFEEHLVAGRQAADAGRLDDAAEAYTAALALVRGQPLDDLADSDVGRAPTMRLNELVASARAARLEIQAARGELADAAAELEDLVAAEPLDEHWWALLMTVRYRQGRPADALRTFQQARRVLATELGLEPGPELRELERRVLAHDEALLGERAPAPGRVGTRPRPAALPARLPSLIGRDELLAAIGADTTRHRLVTLVGPGGAGKTALALELARRHREPVAFVDLAPVGDPDAIVSTLSASLGLAAADTPIAGSAATSLERIADSIAGEPMLVVVDNCEHLVEAAAKMVHHLLHACPQLVVVATSREALGVPGEAVRPVPPLPGDAAVELFRARAAAAAPGFELTPDDLRVVADICACIDNLPLAIELAAARIRSLHPREIRARLDDRFALLATGARTVEPRQQTLRAVVDWSHDLLDDAERTVFRRLAAFSGGATMASLEAVLADGEHILGHQVAGVVERLIDKSLVNVERRAEASRYWMLQTLAEYAADRLRESGEVELVRDRHAHHVADLLEPAGRGLLGRDQRHWIDVISRERENLRTALDIAVARGDANLALRLTAPVGWYFYMVAEHDVGRAALEDALSCPGPTDPRLRAIVLAHYSWLAANGSELGTAREATAEAVDTLVLFDDPWVESFVLVTRMMALFFSGQITDVVALMPRAEGAAERSDDPWSVAMTALVRGELANTHGDASAAEAAFATAIAIMEEVGDEFGLAVTLTEAAEIAEMRGDYDEAIDLLSRGLAMSERVGFSGWPVAIRARLANVEVLRGNLELAEQLHRQLLCEVGDEALPWLRAMSAVGLAVVARRSGRIDDADEWLEYAWSVTRDRPSPVMRAVVQAARGYTADIRGDHETALACQLDGLRTVDAERAPRAMANALEGTAGALAAGPEPAGHRLAARLLGAADALRRRSGGPMPPAERFDVDRAEQRARQALGPSAFTAEFSSGAGASVADLVADLLDHGG